MKTHDKPLTGKSLKIQQECLDFNFTAFCLFLYNSTESPDYKIITHAEHYTWSDIKVTNKLLKSSMSPLFAKEM